MTGFFLVIEPRRWTAMDVDEHTRLARGRFINFEMIEQIFGGRVEIGENGTTGVVWREPHARSIPLVVRQ